MALKTLASLSDILRIASHDEMQNGHDVWWRGQREAKPLVARAFREEYAQNPNVNEEINRCVRFRLRAGTRYDRCPAFDDEPSWLVLMQHFGLPTRLLDWTESVLCAAFFAVEEQQGHLIDETDGEIWMLIPHLLNEKQYGERSLFTSDHPLLETMFGGAFKKTEPKFDGPIALLPKELDIRMLVQQSTFTIHPQARPLEEEEEATVYLNRFQIPKSAKATIRGQLKKVGIARSTLFPDLANLASDIGNEPFDAP